MNIYMIGVSVSRSELINSYIIITVLFLSLYREIDIRRKRMQILAV